MTVLCLAPRLITEADVSSRVVAVALRVGVAVCQSFVIRERFFRWEEGRRQSFFVESASLPNYRRLGDDLQLTPLSPSSCRLVWTIAAEPRPWARRPKSPTA